MSSQAQSVPRRRDRSNWYRADRVQRETYTVAETAKILGIGLRQAYEAIQRGEIPARKIGGRQIVFRAALHAMLGLAPETAPVESGDHRTATDDRQGPESRQSSRLPSGSHRDSDGGV